MSDDPEDPHEFIEREQKDDKDWVFRLQIRIIQFLLLVIAGVYLSRMFVPI